MKAVVWGAPSLHADLAAAGFALVDQHCARVALVRVEHERDVAVVRRLVEEHGVPIVVMLDPGPEMSALALEVVELGARGLVEHHAPIAEIAHALVEAAAGRCVVAPPCAELLLDAVRARKEATISFALTPRERDVLAELATGLTNSEIASRLEVSLTTVQTHLKSLFRKLDVRSRAAATALAMRHRLV